MLKLIDIMCKPEKSRSHLTIFLHNSELVYRIDVKRFGKRSCYISPTCPLVETIEELDNLILKM